MSFNFNMSYQEFDNYLIKLTARERNNLFHLVYEAYLYVGEAINAKGVRQSEFFKCMSKLKRYEQYLYKILQS